MNCNNNYYAIIQIEFCCARKINALSIYLSIYSDYRHKTMAGKCNCVTEIASHAKMKLCRT